MFEAVIFDWDGTLVNSHQIVVASFQKALSEINCRISDEFIKRLVGVGAAETIREILRACKICYDEALINKLVKKKVQKEIEMIDKIKPFAGALELLETLQGRVKVGLASMNNREIISLILRTKNMQKFFDVVITANDIKKSKPNPEIFLKCAAKLKCKPNKCAVVEDSIFGVEAAKAAKMGCIAVHTGAYSREEINEAKPELTVDSLLEIRKILNFIFR